MYRSPGNTRLSGVAPETEHSDQTTLERGSVAAGGVLGKYSSLRGGAEKFRTKLATSHCHMIACARAGRAPQVPLAIEYLVQLEFFGGGLDAGLQRDYLVVARQLRDRARLQLLG
jgi:hypothetical protein